MSGQNNIVATSIGDIQIKKLVIRDFAEMLKKLNKLPERLDVLEGTKAEDLVSAIIPMLVDSLPEISELIAFATVEKTGEDIQKLELLEFMKILHAILEVNQYEEIVRFFTFIRSKVSPQKASAPQAKK